MLASTLFANCNQTLVTHLSTFTKKQLKYSKSRYMRHSLVRLLATTILATAVASAWAADPVGDDGVIRFEINRFEVKGNTLLPQARIDSLVAPFLGKSRDFGDVQRALEALEAAYHALGYKLVTIELPEQELNRGEVLLRV